MNKNNPLWASVSLLIAAVIAVLAFIRGNWMIPLLVAVFAVWGLWVFVALGLPVLRDRREQRMCERNLRELEKAKKAEELREAQAAERSMAAVPGSEMAQTLLRHVNHRVSAQLKVQFPDARWEWKVENPTLLAVQGGIGRIRVYGVPGFDFADVELDPSGCLACSLVKSLAEKDAEPGQQPEPPNRQPADPSAWYAAQGQKILASLIGDLDSRGHNQLFIREDGSAYIRPVDGGEETMQESFRSFPAKDCWAKLVKVLEDAGYAATAQEDCIAVVW